MMGMVCTGAFAFMIVTTSYQTITGHGAALRAFVAVPQAPGSYPGILCYSDIFQMTGPMLRSCTRLAGYGFVVAGPRFMDELNRPIR